MKRIILFGAPGAGKGTQADMLEKKYGYKKISTGDLIRAEVAAQTEVGLMVKAILEKGDLVSDAIVFEILKNRLAQSDIGDGYILDGFPRTKAQARELSRIKVDSEIAIHLKIRRKALITRRLLSRRTCGSCGAIFNLMLNPPKKMGRCDYCGNPVIKRADDNKKTIGNRLRVYSKQTRPVISYYRKKTLLRVVDASAPVSSVFEKVVGILN